MIQFKMRIHALYHEYNYQPMLFTHIVKIFNIHYQYLEGFTEDRIYELIDDGHLVLIRQENGNHEPPVRLKYMRTLK